MPGFSLDKLKKKLHNTQETVKSLETAAEKASKARLVGVTKEQLQKAIADTATGLREMRDKLMEQEDWGEADTPEIEVRLGVLKSKTTGQRFENGKGLFVIPSSAGVITDLQFDADVGQARFGAVTARRSKPLPSGNDPRPMRHGITAPARARSAAQGATARVQRSCCAQGARARVFERRF